MRLKNRNTFQYEEVSDETLLKTFGVLDVPHKEGSICSCCGVSGRGEFGYIQKKLFSTQDGIEPSAYPNELLIPDSDGSIMQLAWKGQV